MHLETHWVDEGEMVDLFFLDFAKATDRVPQQRLLLNVEAQKFRSWWKTVKMGEALAVG